VTVSGATAYGIKSDQVTWGWLNGAFSGKSLVVTGMANVTYSVTWFNSTNSGGTVISTATVAATGGTLTASIPTTTLADIAFKLTPPTTVLAGDTRKAEPRPLIAYRSGAIRLLTPVAARSVVQIMTALGRVVAERTIPDAKATTVAVGRLNDGVYFVKITSGAKILLQRLTVGY
jgi:hypothetical protein